MSPETLLLRHLARPQLNADQIPAVKELWYKELNHSLLIASAEKHGLSSLLYRHLTRLELDIDQTVRQQLIALNIRHLKANQARQHALEEILSLFSGQDIRSIVLKGAALIHVLYENIALRPMSDLDILVPEDQAQQAQTCLGQLDYKLHKNLNPYLRDHHHLPMASKQVEGTSIHVEIHTDALSRDNSRSICFENLQAEPVAFKVGDQTTHSLGHHDMLRHLCHHTLEPVEEIKLIAVSDIYGYATRYLEEIDFALLDKIDPVVHNTMQLFHYLSPLPERIQDRIQVPVASAPAGVGRGFTPLSQTLGSNQGIFAKIRNVFFAPAWWLHCFYEIGPEQSLRRTQLFTHPAQVAKWIIRRWRAKYSAANQ